ncbi:hypothetical protein [Bradyrhizobium neotropicale]|uniref:hypothetical protein n=1 Tax=Bradyrhizobium neotropicale TaxID=1497615 RepID=UPI001AD75231|nr:hypothetical protein [Bradyrhizobium neotropicale]
MMLSEEFSQKTIAAMDLALERACRFLPIGLPEHQTRKFVAEKIIECAKNGNQTLAGLTEVGRRAIHELIARRNETADEMTLTHPDGK